VPTPSTDDLRGLTVGEIRSRARQDAENVLAAYWAPGALPVDPVSVARALGLSVFSAQLEDDVFGMLVGGAEGADIYLDKDQPRARFRFSCAHEIGHYVLRSEEIAKGCAFIDRRSDVARGTPDEIYANEFAGSLLMPHAALRSAVNEREDDFDLMRRFDVSLDALRYRRQILGF
jgi:Zn-dependent peptidase ImmA (M78 family)